MATDGTTGAAAELPLACRLTAAEQRVRGEETAALFGRARGVEELADGYRFTFPADDSAARDLLAFILAERACCPFFTFDLTFAAPHTAVALAVRGREGVKAIMRGSVEAARSVAAAGEP